MEKGLVFGLNIGDLLEIYDRDSRSWKMSGCLFTGDYAKCSGALPKSGMMRNGRIYAQATWARRTGGKESGLLPTPNTMEGIKPKKIESIVKTNQKNRPGRSTLSMNLRELIYYGERDLHGNPKMWRTPRAGNPGSRPNVKGGKVLAEEVKKFPTPQARDFRSGQMKRVNRPGFQNNLNDIVKMYPTITVNDSKNSITESQRGRGTLTDAMLDEKQNTPDGQLNPPWVEWLMGFPGVDRLKGLGNAIVPQIAELLFNQIKELV